MCTGPASRTTSCTCSSPRASAERRMAARFPKSSRPSSTIRRPPIRARAAARSRVSRRVGPSSDKTALMFGIPYPYIPRPRRVDRRSISQKFREYEILSRILPSCAACSLIIAPLPPPNIIGRNLDSSSRQPYNVRRGAGRSGRAHKKTIHPRGFQRIVHCNVALRIWILYGSDTIIMQRTLHGC